jgi:hypothetical protein
VNSSSSLPNDAAQSAFPQPPEAEQFVTIGPYGYRFPIPPVIVDPDPRDSTPPEIMEAQDTFYRELSELLKERRGQWVAYHGKTRIGFGKTKGACGRIAFGRDIKSS